MAREAFDELELAEDAEERSDLERKLEEAASGPSHVNQASAQETTSIQGGVNPAPAPPAPPASGTTESALPSANGSPQTQTKIAKPRTSAKGKGVVAREMAKFKAAQARSSSTSRLHEMSRASPNPGGPPADSSPKSIKAAKADRASTPVTVNSSANAEGSGKSQAAKRKSSDRVDTADKVEKGEKRRRGRHPSPTFTSSEEEDETPNRGRLKRPVKANPVHPDSTGRDAPVESADPPSGSVLPPLASKRKAPPQPLDLSRQSRTAPVADIISAPIPIQASTPSTTASDRPDDPEDLRDRYEELYPAYQQMTLKLIALHRAAEGVELGDGDATIIPEKMDLAKMVKKWERWHNELMGIRRWFGSTA